MNKMMRWAGVVLLVVAWLPSMADAGALIDYPLNGTPAATDQLLMLDDPLGTWATNRVSISVLWDLLRAAPGEIGGTTPAAGTFTTLAATSFTAAASATPKFTFNDSDAANGEATIFAQANGAFDTIMYLAVDVAGTETDYVELDGVTETIDLLKPVVITGNVGATTYGSDGSISNAELLTLDDCALTEAFVGGGAGSAPVCTTVTGTGAPVLATSPTLVTPVIGVATGTSLALTGTLSGGVPTNTDADGMSQGEMTAAGLYGTMFFAGGAATWNLPAVGTGMSCCVYSTTAAAVVINPDDADRIVLNGTAKADGAALTSASAAGDFICLIADSAAGWTTLGRSGTWTAP